MPDLKELEVGVMFWAGRDPISTLQEIKALGVRCGQLGVPGELPLEGAAEAWASALGAAQFQIVTVFCSYTGESYADMPTVERTVGFVPHATRSEREQRTKQVIDFAAAIGVKSIACHIGCVPEDPDDPEYQAVRNLVRRICDYCAMHGQTFALETGQEPADVLLRFVRDVDRTNLGINFDPANMIVYGTGDPVQALGVLGPYIVSVHAKDGCWPPKDTPGALGTETCLGEGAVGIEPFLAKLKQIGYTGSIHVEREGAQGPEQWMSDLRAGVQLLESLRG